MQTHGIGKAFGKVLTYLLVVLLLLGVFGAIIYVTAREKGITFYVEYNGERYFPSYNSMIYLPPDQQHTFRIKSLTDSKEEFAVRVLAAENNMLFSVGDELHSLYHGDEQLDDYSSVFGLSQDGNEFQLSFPDGFTVERAIEEKYESDVTLLYEISSVTCYFKIQVRSGKSQLDLPISLDIPVTDIIISPPAVIF